MEKLFFKKIELWVVVVLAVFGVLGAILFAAILRNELLGWGQYGKVGDLAVAVSELPATVEQVLWADEGMKAADTERFGDRAGWQVDIQGDIPGFLLLSRFDGDLSRPVVEAVDLSDFSVRHTWTFDAGELFEGANVDMRFADVRTVAPDYFRAIHPLLAGNGDLIVKNHDSPLLRVDACGAPLWMNDTMSFHHSTNAGTDDTLWVPAYVVETDLEGVNEGFFDDALVHLDAEGEVTEVISVTRLLLDHGLSHRLFGNLPYAADKMHLNDIEPVLEDGPFWKRGDLFFNMRNISAVALYRPSTDEIVWYREGPWSLQHDVDILDDHRIGVFDNAVIDRGSGLEVATHSSVAVYDFETDQVTRPWDAGMAAEEVRTTTEGLFEALPGGELLVEEENSGRILILGPDGSVIAQYVNRAEDGNVYRLGWSRYVEEEFGNEVLSRIEAGSCP